MPTRYAQRQSQEHHLRKHRGRLIFTTGLPSPYRSGFLGENMYNMYSRKTYARTQMHWQLKGFWSTLSPCPHSGEEEKGATTPISRSIRQEGSRPSHPRLTKIGFNANI